MSGPGQVSFDTGTEPRTLAFFTAAGEYELQLTGNDSELQNTTTVKVIVAAS